MRLVYKRQAPFGLMSCVSARAPVFVVYCFILYIYPRRVEACGNDGGSSSKKSESAYPKGRRAYCGAITAAGRSLCLAATSHLIDGGIDVLVMEAIYLRAPAPKCTAAWHQQNYYWNFSRGSCCSQPMRSCRLAISFLNGAINHIHEEDTKN